MTLQSSLLRRLENPNLNRNIRVKLRCELSREFEDRGDYESAREAMGEIWQRIGERPAIEGLKRGTAAEVLLRVGTLTGWIGSKNQVTDSQETAKNLITESFTLFQSFHNATKVAEAQIELALCYWRTGEHNEARDVLKEVLSRLTEDSELKALALLRWAILEWSALRYGEALRILMDTATLFEKISSHTIKGGYHNALASLLEDVGRTEQREEYIDRAFVEYTAASYHFEQAGHKPYRANVENNLGFLYFKAYRYKEAHEHLDRARRILVNLKDSCALAQCDETRARVFLAEGRNAEAEKTARASVIILEQGDHQDLLSEALITHGTALARLGYYSQAYATLQDAIEAAQASGSLNRSAEAALILIQELGEHLTLREKKVTLPNSGMEAELQRYEHDLIKDALVRANGSVTQAARLLGTSHQRIAQALEKKHRDLLPLRAPIIRRPKS
ncbi:MAG: helix-turn-helix domain-containing protein [Pyrinomonadaceae bacterium]